MWWGLFSKLSLISYQIKSRLAGFLRSIHLNSFQIALFVAILTKPSLFRKWTWRKWTWTTRKQLPTTLLVVPACSPINQDQSILYQKTTRASTKWTGTAEYKVRSSNIALSQIRTGCTVTSKSCKFSFCDFDQKFKTLPTIETKRAITNYQLLSFRETNAFEGIMSKCLKYWTNRTNRGRIETSHSHFLWPVAQARDQFRAKIGLQLWVICIL